MKKQSIASAPPREWNQKNLPSDQERFEQRPGETVELIEQLPAAAVALARRRRGVLLWSLAALAVGGLAWFFVRQD